MPISIIESHKFDGKRTLIFGLFVVLFNSSALATHRIEPPFCNIVNNDSIFVKPEKIVGSKSVFVSEVSRTVPLKASRPDAHSMNDYAFFKVFTPMFNVIYPVYDVTYTLNKYALRIDIDDPQNLNSKNFLLVGGDRVFGKGLENNQTLSEYLNNYFHSPRVRNLGYLNKNIFEVFDELYSSEVLKKYPYKNVVILIDNDFFPEKYRFDALVEAIDKMFFSKNVIVIFDDDLKAERSSFLSVMSLFRGWRVVNLGYQAQKNPAFSLSHTSLPSSRGNQYRACVIYFAILKSLTKSQKDF